MGSRTDMRPAGAFTLLELTVTLAIISLLALVSVPIVQHSLIRARLADAQNNLRLLRDGLELFAAEHGRYPNGSTSPSNALYSDFDASLVLRPLVGRYLPDAPNLLLDDFSRETMQSIKESIVLNQPTLPDILGYSYFDYERYHVPPWTPLRAFALVSVGPDSKDSGLGIAIRNPTLLNHLIYSPSNGIRSGGDIGITNAPLNRNLH